MGSLKKEAQNYLDRCRVVKSTELIEGLIVEFDTIADFRIVEITKKGNEVSSKVVATFDCVGVFDEDESIKILGFKKSVFDILGRKRYYIDEGVYNFLVNEDIDDILSDLQIETVLKEKISDAIFSNDTVREKRIALRKLKRDGLDKSFIKLFLNLLEYIEQI